MLFNSIEFVAFLPAVVLLYYLLPGRFRWILLLLASYSFYMFWKAEYAVLIAASTLVDYLAALQMAKRERKRDRTPFLILSLLSNLGLLFAFKYANFFSTSVNALFGSELPMLDLLLPVGISFYTFQTLSYSIDVFKGKQKPERHLGYFAVYVAFFPQLVAGPIERFSRLGPQLRTTHAFNYDNFAAGFRLMLYGFFVKMVVADNLAGYINAVYDDPAGYNNFSVALGMGFYSFQIYCDFYGYSLIAIGSARLLGIRLMNNFHTPYLSVSVADFWQRWHISLSTWFRDYLYIPLGGNKVTLPRWSVNILLVFTISGLWHGANWTFILWGAIWGMAYLVEKLIGKVLKLPKIKPWTFLHFFHALKMFGLATLAWLPFRAENLEQMKEMLSAFFLNAQVPFDLELTMPPLLFLLLFIVSDVLLYNRRIDTWLGNRPLVMRWTIYVILIFSVLVFAAVEEFPFIYFQF